MAFLPIKTTDTGQDAVWCRIVKHCPTEQFHAVSPLGYRFNRTGLLSLDQLVWPHMCNSGVGLRARKDSGTSLGAAAEKVSLWDNRHILHNRNRGHSRRR